MGSPGAGADEGAPLGLPRALGRGSPGSGQEGRSHGGHCYMAVVAGGLLPALSGESKVELPHLWWVHFASWASECSAWVLGLCWERGLGCSPRYPSSLPSQATSMSLPGLRPSSWCIPHAAFTSSPLSGEVSSLSRPLSASLSPYHKLRMSGCLIGSASASKQDPKACGAGTPSVLV